MGSGGGCIQGVVGVVSVGSEGPQFPGSTLQNLKFEGISSCPENTSCSTVTMGK